MKSMLPSVLGLWQFGSEELEINFDAASPATPESGLWLSVLPANVAEAEEAQRRLEENQEQAIRRLENIPAQLEQLADLARVKICGGPSFGQAQSMELAPPEAALLAEVERLGQRSYFESYDISRFPSQGWQAVMDPFQSAVDAIQQLVSCLSEVETRVGEKVVGRTKINFKGSLFTYWNTPLVLNESELHLSSVRQALASRAALIKMVSTTAQGAVLTAALVGAPGSALLVLPAVWRYIQTVLDH
jgi:hypothetical protein